jgi:hypothetical protein
LRAIERQDYDVLKARPVIAKRTKLALALRAVCCTILPFLHARTRFAPSYGASDSAN